MTTDSTDKKPNIIWVFPDQMRGQAMSVSGDENVATPHLDKLAGEGVRFTAACSSYPVCVPFRFTALTGESASSRWIPTIHWRMSPAETTVAHVLNDQGYQTCYVGKWHLYGGDYHNTRFKRIPVPREHQGGFQRWKGFELRNNPFDTWYFAEEDPEPKKIDGYQSDGLFGIAMSEMEQMSKADNPFFLALSVEPPHPPYMGPGMAGKKRDTRTIRFRKNVDAEKCSTYSPDVFDHVSHGIESSDNEDILKAHLAEYYASIENIDTNMGRLLEKLANLNILDNTVVMFFSDHGELLGSHGLQAKQWPYEESVNIPFIVRIPEALKPVGAAGAGRVVSDPIHTEDIFPTTLAFAGVTCEGKPGRNLVPWITGEMAPDREGVFLEFVEEHRDKFKTASPRWRAYRTRDFKYVVTQDGPYMLYDLKGDPYEMENLIGNEAYRDVRDNMHSVLMQHLQTNDPSFFYAYRESAG
jgi:arylsulfatase A-like enzyme